MRRALFTIVASVAVFAFLPATAMARSHHRRHHTHHARRHARIRRFGHFVDPPPAGAATVKSFDPMTGKLVITLNDGTTTETGVVTSDTEIDCQSSQQIGDDMSSDASGDNGDQSGGDDDQGDDDQGGNCSTANLTPGAVVLAASLQIDGSGAVWDTIELASTGTSGSGDQGDQGGDGGND
jgi:hypothetical protein